jgi:lysine-N-methylase
MSLPLATLPLAERWDCHQCGICCYGSIVRLSEQDREKLRQQGWEKHPDYRGQPIMVREGWFSSQYHLAQRPDGGCVFLTAEGLCRIHKEFGFEAKPLLCQMFPRQIIPLGDRAVLTIRRACPSAAQDLGRPVEEHLPDVRRLADEGKLLEKASGAPAIKRGERRPWKVALALLRTLSRLVADERFPPVRRIVHGLVLCRLLTQARTRRLDDIKLIDLLEVLETTAPDEAAPLFAQRRPLSRIGGILFRQIGLEYIRLHPAVRIQNTWAERWKLVRFGMAMLRAIGQVPPVSDRLPQVEFAALEEPLGVLEPEIYRPFARYLETLAASYQYALARRVGWSIVESFHSLALTYPLGLWMMRWVCAGRKPTLQDSADIVTALDRGQGYIPLCGTRQRIRLRLLTNGDDLERAVIWYAR